MVPVTAAAAAAAAEFLVGAEGADKLAAAAAELRQRAAAALARYTQEPRSRDRACARLSAMARPMRRQPGRRAQESTTSQLAASRALSGCKREAPERGHMSLPNRGKLLRGATSLSSSFKHRRFLASQAASC